MLLNGATPRTRFRLEVVATRALPLHQGRLGLGRGQYRLDI